MGQIRAHAAERKHCVGLRKEAAIGRTRLAFLCWRLSISPRPAMCPLSQRAPQRLRGAAALLGQGPSLEERLAEALVSVPEYELRLARQEHVLSLVAADTRAMCKRMFGKLLADKTRYVADQLLCGNPKSLWELSRTLKCRKKHPKMATVPVRDEEDKVITSHRE